MPRYQATLKGTLLDKSNSVRNRKEFSSSFNIFTGLGPGGLKIINTRFDASKQCIPGSSHGGKVKSPNNFFFESSQTYDRNDTESLLGGSGGEIVIRYRVIVNFAHIYLFIFEDGACSGGNDVTRLIFGTEGEGSNPPGVRFSFFWFESSRAVIFFLSFLVNNNLS